MSTLYFSVRGIVVRHPVSLDVQTELNMDTAEHAMQLAALLKNRLAHVNLIPFNAVPELGLKPRSPNVVNQFAGILKKKKINVNLRRRLGADIAAACGQLRNNSCMDSNPVQ